MVVVCTVYYYIGLQVHSKWGFGEVETLQHYCITVLQHYDAFTWFQLLPYSLLKHQLQGATLERFVSQPFLLLL